MCVCGIACAVVHVTWCEKRPLFEPALGRSFEETGLCMKQITLIWAHGALALQGGPVISKRNQCVVLACGEPRTMELGSPGGALHLEENKVDTSVGVLLSSLKLVSRRHTRF